MFNHNKPNAMNDSVEVEISTKKHRVIAVDWHMRLERFPTSINYKS